MNTVLDNIKDFIREPLQEIGLWVIQVRIMGSENNTVIQIMVDKLNRDGCVNIRDCEASSHIISAILDVENILDRAYTLEVSTPGIDRPLVIPEDWIKYIGHLVKVDMNIPLSNGRRKFKGKIVFFRDDLIKLENDIYEVELNFKDINFAKLVLTDELIAFSGLNR